MGKNHDGDIRGFINGVEAWYRDKSRDDYVSFGWYDPNGEGTTGEMQMTWIPLSGTKPTPRLECFDDGWHALYTFSDVLERLAEVDDQNITPAQFCQILTNCGFVDMTKRKREE